MSAVLLQGFPGSYVCTYFPRHAVIDLNGVDESRAQDEMNLCRSGYPTDMQLEHEVQVDDTTSAIQTLTSLSTFRCRVVYHVVVLSWAC